MEIPYKVIKSNIKNLYIQIKDGEVLVKAPKRYSESEIARLVSKKQRWIEKSLQSSKQRQEKEPLYEQEEFLQIVEKNVKELIKITRLKTKTCKSKKN